MASSALAAATSANAPKTELPTKQDDPLLDHISPHKYAVFALCDRHGVSIANEPIIKALITEGDKTIESQYQTPFENSNPEQKAPVLLGMLQSGTASDLLSGDNIITRVLGKNPFGTAEKIESFANKTNLTKINTTQIFMSTSSIRVNLSLVFIALKDASLEVEKKIQQLEEWSLPVSLSDEGIISDGLYSGVIPPYVSVTISGKTYKPFVIENISAPIISPTDSSGNRLNVAVTISLLSRAAWDAGDIRNLYNPK